jgi:nicotinate dehydrogenase subunit A
MRQGEREHLLRVNGAPVRVGCDPSRSLLDVLRSELSLTGTRAGCEAGQCGACFVLVDGRAVSSCDTPMWSVQGKSVTTVEGLGDEQRPHPLQRAFVDEQAAQCGYCTSGLLISAAALLARNPDPDADEVKAALERNLCRCGTHNRVVRAVLRAARG